MAHFDPGLLAFGIGDGRRQGGNGQRVIAAANVRVHGPKSGSFRLCATVMFFQVLRQRL